MRPIRYCLSRADRFRLQLGAVCRPIPPLRVSGGEVVSSLEEEGLIRYGVNWVQQLRLFLENISDVVKRPVDSRIQNRLIEVFGNNMQGDAVLILSLIHISEPTRPY